MTHKIALVVHLPSPSSSPTTTPSTTAPAKNVARYRTPSTEPRIKVLIQVIGTLDHRKCLIGGFGAIAERVIGGLLTGEQEIVQAAVEGGVKGKKGGKEDGLAWKEEGGQGKNGPVWDVAPWEDYC